MLPPPPCNTAHIVRQPQQRAGQREHCLHPPVYHPPVHGQGQYQVPVHGHGQGQAGQYQVPVHGHGQGPAATLQGRNEGHSALW